VDAPDIIALHIIPVVCAFGNPLRDPQLVPPIALCWIHRVPKRSGPSKMDGPRKNRNF